MYLCKICDCLVCVVLIVTVNKIFVCAVMFGDHRPQTLSLLSCLNIMATIPETCRICFALEFFATNQSRCLSEPASRYDRTYGLMILSTKELKNAKVLKQNNQSQFRGILTAAVSYCLKDLHRDETHTHTHTHIHTYTHTHVHTHMCTHTRAHTRAHTHTHSHTHTHTHTHVHTQHTHTHTHTHTCTHTHTYTASARSVNITCHQYRYGIENIYS